MRAQPAAAEPFFRASRVLLQLGVEVPIHEVITYQKEMVELCLAAGKPVIVATQMLESMQKNPRPTRAEVADVTNAVLDGADAVMLSGESANGQYPSESVGTQADIIAHTEQWALARGMGMGGQFSDDGISMEALGEDDDLDAEADAIGAAACTLAGRVGAAAIIVVEHAQGHETRAIVKHRPDCPIISLAPSLKVCRQLNLSRGVQPLYVDDDAAAAEAAILVCLSHPLTSSLYMWVVPRFFLFLFSFLFPFSLSAERKTK